jgi:membrane fusion protein, multidrug efflux system
LQSLTSKPGFISLFYRFNHSYIDKSLFLNYFYLYFPKLQPLKPIYLVAGLLFLFSCKSKKEAPKQNPGQQSVIVDVIIAKSQKISNIVEANGAVVANEYAELHPEVSGRIIFLDLPEGKLVKKGTVLVRINDADLQAQLAKTKVLLNLAEITEQRNKKLLAVNGINQNDYDVALNQVNSLKADLQYTQALIDKTVIRAPFDGTLGLRLISPGAFVTANTLVATIQQLNKLKLDFTVPENYSHLIKNGKTIEVTIDGGKAEKRKATIYAIEPQVNSLSRNLKIRAYLDGNANPGAFAKIYLDAGENSKSIMVPANAIIPEAKTKKLVVVKNGKAIFTSITTGIRNTAAVEVLTGIQEGDSVVVSGVLFNRPNGNVNVRKVVKLEDMIR